LGDDPDNPYTNSNAGNQEMIFSPITPITLDSEGDKVVFTGSVTLNGTVNSPATLGNPRTQFRFGIFQSSSSTDETGWIGYFMHNKHGNAGSPQGVLALKPVGNTSAFLSTSGQTTIQAQAGDGTAASLFNDGTYNLSMSIERNAAGELVLNSSIIGTGNRPPVQAGDFNGDNVVDSADYVLWRNGGPLVQSNEAVPIGTVGDEDYTLWRDNFGNIAPVVANEFSQIMSGTHTTASTSGTFTFDRIGFLLGANLGTDRAAFANLDVTFTPGASGSGTLAGGFGVPEPATFVLLAIAAAAIAIVSRRRTVPSAVLARVHR
jgi:hypothetical protein